MLTLKKKLLDLFKAQGHLKSPNAEAEQILFCLFRKKNSLLKTYSDLFLQNPTADSELIAEAIRIAHDRFTGIPLQHLLKTQFFGEHEYTIDDSVLIPRPETEFLFSLLLKKISTPSAPLRFAELGLGSGILSIELLSRFSHFSAVASEVSSSAILIAEENFKRIVGQTLSSRLKILQPNSSTVGFEIFVDQTLVNGRPFDFVISNPPYVSTKDSIEKEVLDHEPHEALFPPTQDGRESPNYFYENFLMHSPRLLSENGFALFEVPHERAESLLEKFQKSGSFTAQLHPDLTGRPRVLEASRILR